MAKGLMDALKGWRRALHSLEVERIVVIGYALSLFGIFGLGVFAHSLCEKQIESAASIAHAERVMAHVEELHHALIDADATAQVFILWGDAAPLENYSHTLRAVDSRLQEFRRLTQNDATQRKLSHELQEKIAQHFSMLDREIGAQKQGGQGDRTSSGLRRDSQGIQTIKTAIGKMKEQEKQLLSQRIKEYEGHVEAVKTLTWVAVILGSVIVTWIFWQAHTVIKLKHDAEQRARHSAHHDALTGLPNRRLLEDRANIAIAQAHRHNHALALLFIDLDGFKQVNDTLGHDYGDLLLERVASRLKNTVRPEDTVARLGGTSS